MIPVRQPENGTEVLNNVKRVRKYWRSLAAPPTTAEQKNDLRIVVADNKAKLSEVEKADPARDWLHAASAAMATCNFIVSVKSIQRVVCAYYNCGLMDLKSHRRTQPITFYRQIAMYLCKELTTNSLPAIGRQFGNRDHTTVLHAMRKLEGLRRNDKALDDQIKELTATIMSRPEPAEEESNLAIPAG
jgi:hypothetical protein